VTVKRPVAFHLGMWASMILALLTAGVVLHLLGWASPLLVLVVGFLLAGVFWWLLRPIFFFLSTVPGYIRSPLRREFKEAWKKLDCKQHLVGADLDRLHAQSPVESRSVV
jgi:hypothetical protein